MTDLVRRALIQSDQAEACGALVPLSTERLPEDLHHPFVLRRLLSETPKHLRSAGPKPNPFLPWDPRLELETVGAEHLLLLNKYPVQRGHLLLITQRWQPQAGWLSSADWRALQSVEQETTGLWFFNSCAAAGASQPHRHLQLLPRSPDEPSCPLADQIAAQAEGTCGSWPWRYRISPRQAVHGPERIEELESLYRQHCRELKIGEREQHPTPRQPYNLLLDRSWFMTVCRTQEHWAGFSINALGFAGYLLITEGSDETWLHRHGAWQLLKAVAAV